MLEVSLLLARYVFLFLLYLFLWITYRGMMRELRSRRDPLGPGTGEPSRPGAAAKEPEEGEERRPRTPNRLRLVVVQSEAGQFSRGTYFSLVGSVTFGRAEDNTIIISDRFASSHHARLRQQSGGELWLEDLGSTNGTRLNGQDIPALTAVRIGDEIGIGTVQFRVEKE